MHHFLILGGDPRQLYLSGLLEQAGQEVSLYYENPSFFPKGSNGGFRYHPLPCAIFKGQTDHPC